MKDKSYYRMVGILFILVSTSLLAIFREQNLSQLLPKVTFDYYSSLAWPPSTGPFPERFGVPRVTQRQNTTSSSLLPPPFDYQAFWNQSLAMALANQQRLMQQQPPKLQRNNITKPCPKVYVYNLSQSMRDSNVPLMNPTLDQVFGPTTGMNGHLRKTPQWGFAQILDYRLSPSATQECVTDDPQQADLFYVPIMTRPKGGSEWGRTCANLTVDAILQELAPHLTPQTACRHFFVISKGHYVGNKCTGWFSNPVPLLQHSMRLAFSHSSKGSKNQTALTASSQNATQQKFPNLFSVPYPSNLHWSTTTTMTPPWTQFGTNRKYLMRYLGKDSHGDKPVRQRIVQQCQSYQNHHICPSDITFTMTSLQEKGQTVFCLEPAGDSPWRRSLADSISFGCIPVLFSPLTDDTSPFAWGAWKPQARVLVPRQEFVDGRIDLYQLLSTIPIELLELMQTTIAKYGRQFLYSLDDDPHDGIRQTLYGLKEHAESMKRQGLCQ